MKETGLFKALQSKDIVNLFIDGSVLPYRSYTDIINLVSKFDAINNPYNLFDGIRIGSMLSILSKVHELNKTSDFLSYWLNPINIGHKVKDVINNKPDVVDNILSNYEISNTSISVTSGCVYDYIINKFVNSINGELVYSGLKLIHNDNKFNIIKLKSFSHPVLSIKRLTSEDNQSIRDLIKEANECFDNKIYDSVVTKSNTLVEATFLKIINEHCNHSIKRNGKTKQYRSKALQSLGMQYNKTWDKRISNMLNGLNKVTDSLDDMRNNDGDAHTGKFKIGRAEAELALNSAETISNYLLRIDDRH